MMAFECPDSLPFRLFLSHMGFRSLMWTDTAAIANRVVIALKWVVITMWVLGIRPGPLEKQPVLLTTERFLCPTPS